MSQPLIPNVMQKDPAPVSKPKPGKYKTRLAYLRQAAVDILFESMALCDETHDIEELILIRNEERKFLLKKLCLIDPHVDTEVQRIIKESYPQLANNNNTPSKPVKKAKKKINSEQGNSESRLKSRKSISSKIKNAKTIVQFIPLDQTGRPIFPIILGNLTVHSLGEVVSDRPDFYCSEAIYPVGYVSTRIYGSMLDPTIKCMYTCKISDKNGCPWFEIATDNEKAPVIAGGSPDTCHSLLLQRINDTLSLNVVSIKPRGHDFFGITHPTILNLIQSSPGTRKCTNYKWSKFEVSKAGDHYVEDPDTCLSYETLQDSINYCKFKMTAPQTAENVLHEEDDLNEYYPSQA